MLIPLLSKKLLHISIFPAPQNSKSTRNPFQRLENPELKNKHESLTPGTRLKITCFAADSEKGALVLESIVL
jgi:hypothetical protein